MADTTKPSGEGPLTLKKFNTTSNPTSTEVITKKVSSADRARRAGLISLVVVALGVLGFIVFRTSGLNPFEPAREHGGGFQAPAHNAPTD